MRERRLHPTVIRYLGPVATAQFIELGWITAPHPHGLTPGGRRAFKNGFGFWDGIYQALPIACADIDPGIGHPYPHWDGIIRKLPGQASAKHDDELDNEEN